MKVSIQMISLEKNELLFLFNHKHQPVVEVNEIQYTSLSKLIDTYPILLSSKHLEKVSQVANFLARGLEFQYLDDLDSYSLSYYDEIKAEESPHSFGKIPLKKYGVFDLSVIHPPSLKEGTLLFFVKHDYLGIPYQVRVSDLNRHHEEPTVSYELLPFAEK